jgi:hypothetical protein
MAEQELPHLVDSQWLVRLPHPALAVACLAVPQQQHTHLRPVGTLHQQ